MIKNGMHASKLGSLDKYSQIILVYNVTVILPLNPSPALIARITHVHTYKHDCMSKLPACRVSCGVYA